MQSQPQNSLEEAGTPTPLTFWGLGSRCGSPLVGQSFQPSLPVNWTLSPCPDHLGPVHQAPGEVASPRPKGRPRPAGPPAPGGEAAETLLTCEMGWGWSRSWRQRASEGTPSSFSGYKACGQCWALRKSPQAPLGTEEAPTGQVSHGQSWEKGPDTAPSCVSPNQPPRFPLQRPRHHPSQRAGRAEQTLRTRCLCEAGGSRRCCAEVHCLCRPAFSLSRFHWLAIVLGRA